MPKLTNKTALSTFADGDLFHVVDISDTSSDPAGTSKKSTWALAKSNILDSLAGFEALYVDTANGNDSTGTGTRSNPFLTAQGAIDSFTAGSALYVIYVNGSSSATITLRSADTGIKFIFDADSVQSGTITLVDGNTDISFLSTGGSATLSGTIADGSKGDVYYNCELSGTYNKTGGSGTASPVGDVRFLSDCHLNGTVINFTGNSSITTLGYGGVGVLTQSNGLFIARHDGTMICPVISGGSPTTGQPITLFQGNIQLLKNGTDDCLTSTSSYGLVFLAGVSSLQQDLSTLGKINFTGAGANSHCYVWANCQLASSGDVFPASGALSANIADYLSANRTAINYTAATSSVKSHLEGIDTAIATSVINDSATARTLALTDANDYIRFTSASATVLTVPLNSTVAFLIGTKVDFIQNGAGQVSVVAAGGVTINKAEGLKIAARYKGASLIKVGADEWDLIGALAA
jgi:hypothetical protein